MTQIRLRANFSSDDEYLDDCVKSYKASPYPEHQNYPNPGYVYFIKADNGLIKIGRTQNIGQRMKELKTMSPEKLTLFHSVKCINYIEAEKKAHFIFDVYRVHGEWFDVPELFQNEILGAKAGDLG